MSNALDTNEARAKAVLDHKHRVVRLADELDKLIKLVTWARESVEAELFSGLGYKKEGLLDKDLKKIKDLSATWNSVVEAKIRFDKAAKQMADSMTPEEERSAVIAYLKSLAWPERNSILQLMKRWGEEKHADPDPAS